MAGDETNTESTPTGGEGGGTEVSSTMPEPTGDVPDPAGGGTEMVITDEMASRYGEVMPESIMNFMPPEVNPQAAGAEGEQPPPTDGPNGPGTPPEGQQQGQGTDPAAQPGMPNEQTPQGNQPPVDPTVAALQHQVQHLTGLLQQQGQQPQGEGQNNDDPLGVMPDYTFNVNPQLLSMLASEDPNERGQAIAALSQGIAQTVHTQVANMVRQVRDGIPTTITEHVQNHAMQQQVHTDFYGKYPELDRPELKQVVQRAALTIMQQQMNMGIQPVWNEQLRDQVATYVKQTLGMQVTAPNPAPDPNNPVPPGTPVDPPPMFGGNSGGGANQTGRFKKGPTSQQDFMNEL